MHTGGGEVLLVRGTAKGVAKTGAKVAEVIGRLPTYQPRSGGGAHPVARPRAHLPSADDHLKPPSYWKVRGYLYFVLCIFYVYFYVDILIAPILVLMWALKMHLPSADDRLKPPTYWKVWVYFLIYVFCGHFNSACPRVIVCSKGTHLPSVDDPLKPPSYWKVSCFFFNLCFLWTFW